MYKDKKEKGELPDPSVFKDIEAGEEGLFVGYDKMGLSRDNLPIAKSSKKDLESSLIIFRKRDSLYC